MDSGLNTVDIVALVLLVLGALNGLRRGLSGELAGAVGVIIAFMFGLLCYGPCGDWLADRAVVSEGTARALMLAGTMAVALLVMLVLKLVFRETVTVSVNSKGANFTMGLVAALIKTAIVVIVVIMCVNLWPNAYLNRVFGEESVIGRFVVRCIPELSDRIVPPPIAEFRAAREVPEAGTGERSHAKPEKREVESR